MSEISNKKNTETYGSLSCAAVDMDEVVITRAYLTWWKIAELEVWFLAGLRKTALSAWPCPHPHTLLMSGTQTCRTYTYAKWSKWYVCHSMSVKGKWMMLITDEGRKGMDTEKADHCHPGMKPGKVGLLHCVAVWGRKGRKIIWAT